LVSLSCVVYEKQETTTEALKKKKSAVKLHLKIIEFIAYITMQQIRFQQSAGSGDRRDRETSPL